MMRPLSALLLTLTACAGAPRAVLHKPAPPLPPSSVAALLAQRGELGLDNEQVARLSAIDRRRQEADREAEVDLEQQEQRAREPKGRLASPASAGRRGAGGGGSAAASGGGRGRGVPPSDDDPVSFAQFRLDEDDAKAYAEAEAVLTETQRMAAREIIARYRDDVMSQRRQPSK
jgi:hypothetical protein